MTHRLLEEEETKIADGIYLTDYRTQESIARSAAANVIASRHHAETEREDLLQRIRELENSINHLLRSNSELAAALQQQADPDFEEAIAENEDVIQRRRVQVEILRELLERNNNPSSQNLQNASNDRMHLEPLSFSTTEVAGVVAEDETTISIEGERQLDDGHSGGSQRMQSQPNGKQDDNAQQQDIYL